MDPVFTPELEQEIFETASIREQSIIPTLLRVCHRVHDWVEPMLYRVLVISDFDLPALAALRSKSSIFKERAVRHVYIEYDGESAAQELLSEFPGIESLVINGHHTQDLLQVMDALRPSRLNIWVPGTSISRWPAATLSRPLFSRVTHLDLYRDPEPEDDDRQASWEEGWSTLASLPALTHLCLDHSLARDIIRPIVENCISLKVMIAAFWSFHRGEEAAKFAQELPSTVRDLRVVVMTMAEFKEDWERGCKGFLERRRQGDFESLTYLLED
ncbi:hypothetical protein R3P38DRAFT_3154196 [Favolaschia claudopus]|uniref:F-box domain-containing protein n=1 Tax=Favolaschia claudopus TaxID=2862362 RepID=A0AAV9YZH3_9AGAR